MRAAAEALRRNLRRNLGLRTMVIPPQFCLEGVWFAALCPDCSMARTSPHGAFVAVLPLSRSISGRHNADASGERFRHGKIAVHDLERQRRERPRGRTVEHGGRLARVEVRVVAGAFENPLLRNPYADLAARVRANGRVGDNTFGGALLRVAFERRRIEPQQQYLVEARSLADHVASSVVRPRFDRRAAERDIRWL